VPFGVAGLPPSAIALPSLAKKSLPPPRPLFGNDEEEDGTENGLPDFLNDLPDPQDLSALTNGSRRKKATGRVSFQPPPPASLGRLAGDEDDSDWTDDDPEDEQEVLALDLPDFSDEP